MKLCEANFNTLEHSNLTYTVFQKHSKIPYSSWIASSSASCQGLENIFNENVCKSLLQNIFKITFSPLQVSFYYF